MSQRQGSVKLCLTLSTMNSGKEGQKNKKGKAIYNYQKFLDLWKDADPGIAEVADARERVLGLRKV
jgi:hypothetical protein